MVYALLTVQPPYLFTYSISLGRYMIATGHPLCSYRLRALQSLKFKLDYCLLTVVDLSADSQLISGLLECLGRNVNENADEVSDSGRQDSSRDQEEEVALSLTLLEVLSKVILVKRKAIPLQVYRIAEFKCHPYKNVVIRIATLVLRQAMFS